MWDRLTLNPRGRVSLRNLIMFATSLLVAILACLWIGTPALAEDAYRLSNGNGFSYQGKDFTTQVVIKPNDQRGLATTQDITAYEYLDTATGKAEYIYNATPTATTASYAAFNVTPQGIYQYIPGPTTVTLSNNPPPGQNQQQQQPQQQTPGQQNQANTVTPSQQNANPSTCTVSGVGWIVCPVTSQLAGMIDGIYGVLMQFLDVKPMLQNGPIFDIWKAVKNIANICFIIAFLVLIYSQVTSLGISNYGIKKMLPRLVIAAILVNVSFWICALGVDLSNFLGHSVYQFLMSFATSLNGFDVQVSWEDLASGILGATAGAGIVAGGLLFSVATGGSLMAALFTLMGMLISVALALITALFILMARQALVIVFVIISPLAFVALVLPKTEKWFDKWKDTFVAMLIMFPLFSLVFGGAVLAGAAIIAGSGDSIFLILLGKGTQLIPLAITPLIVKFSTGLLGTIATFANNKNKGLVDRAKNWTGSQAEYHRKKSIGNPNGRKYNPFRRTAQYFNDRNIRQQREMEGFDAASDARARSTARYRRVDRYTREMEQNKEITANRNEYGWQKYSTGQGFTRTYEVNSTHSLVENQKSINDAMLSEAKAGKLPDGVANTATNRRLVDDLQQTNAQIALNATRKAMAERKIVSDQAAILSANNEAGESARRYAAGIMGEAGERSVQATAKSNASKFLLDDIKNIEATLEYDISSNTAKLYDKFKTSTTDAERIAYTSIMGKRGAPGAIKLRQMLTDMDNRLATGAINREGLNDYKELVIAQNPSIMGSGKDVEFYLTNAAYGTDYGDPNLAGKIKTFNEITNETGTWSNLSAEAFSKMNIINQNQALRVLAHKSPDKFKLLVDGVLSIPSARAGLKAELRDSMEKYGLEQNGGGPDNKYWFDDKDGYNIPKTSELTEFEYHTMFEPERLASEFTERTEHPNKTAADWKAAYDKERAKTKTIIDTAESRARAHGKSFRPSN